MNMSLGIFLHAIGAFAAGSFYMIFRKVKHWNWESYWLISVCFSCILTPCLVAYLTVPHLQYILTHTPPSTIFWTCLFGICWGIGNLTFGLSLRYLGMSLGMALALGLSATFGTLIPPIFMGEFGHLVGNTGGRIILSGIALCLGGIVLAGWAGVSKERELSSADKQKYINEFNLRKGILTAVFSGIMSACVAFGIQSGKPIAEMSIENGAQEVWKNGIVLILIMSGGFIANASYCLYMNIKNRSISNYFDTKAAPLAGNYLFASLAGVGAFMEFMFYGMGASKMGKNDFVSFSIHLALVIVFSTTWGLMSREWKGSSKRTMMLIFAGIFTLIFSTVIMAFGNYVSGFR